MELKPRIKRYARRKITKRLIRAVPWVGTVIAIAAFGSAVRQKGMFNGTLNTALDAIPFLGSAKGVAEIVRGRDFLPDVRKT
jgi:hypothetical protein